MIHFPLSLQLRPTPLPPPTAWLIPSSDPALWLNELTRFGIPLRELRLFVLPRSPRDRSAAALLVIPPPSAAPVQTPRAEPYVCRSDRLYLPANCSLAPDLTDAELQQLLLWDVQALHPTIGLIGYKHDDALCITDLLLAPTRRTSSWDRAVVGLPPRPPLLSVQPEIVPNADDFVRESQDDIGSNAPESLPPAPEESPVRNLASQAAFSILRALNWIARHMHHIGVGSPARSTGGIPIAWKLRQWMARKAAGLSNAMEAARHKELNRLLRLLARDPDQGLRHAISLRDIASRGLAPPGWRLGLRNPDFNLASLFGGRPADPWYVPWDIQQLLQQQYRAAANRELNLHRYRRAAYIFAELLGDFGAAANALQQGRFYREAALLHRDKLHNPVAAAQCLESGGLLLEAIEIYEAHQWFEKAGDLYTRLERHANAQAMYRKAVHRHLANDDLLAAAKLLETKLQAPDEALNLLSGAWPLHDKATPCLTEAFHLLGRLGRHDDAIRRVNLLRLESLEPHMLLPLAETLATVATAYPNPQIRQRSADLARITIGNRLPTAGAAESKGLANSLMRLDAGDRLLARDANRFLNARPSPTISMSSPPSPRKPAKPLLVQAFHLGADIEWKAVCAHAETFHALGVHNDNLVVVCGQWSGQMRRFEWLDPTASQCDFHLEPLPSMRLATITRIGPRSTPAQTIHPIPDIRSAGISFCVLPCLSQGTIHAVFCDERDVLWVVREQDDGNLNLYTHTASSGAVLSSRLLPIRWEQPRQRLHVVARGGVAYVASGMQLIRCGHDHDPPQIIDLHRPITGLAPCSPFVRLRLTTLFPEGGAVIWLSGGQVKSFGDGLFEPVATMTHSGLLIAVGRREGRIYHTSGSTVTQLMTFPAADESPLAIAATDKPHQFALFGRAGLVQVMSVPDQ